MRGGGQPVVPTMRPIERRAAVVFDRGDSYLGPGRLTGTLLTYGEVATIDNRGRRERFEARSVFLSPTISLNREHDPASVIVEELGEHLTLRDGPDALLVEVNLPDTAAARSAAAAVRAGELRGFSVEFHPIEETADPDGTRVIARALLADVGLVGDPAYPSSVVELRHKGRRRIWL